MESIAGPSTVNENVDEIRMIDQVIEAGIILGKPRRGASYIAIRRYILSAYEQPEHERVIAELKKAILMGLECGLLVRPAKCKNCVGATRSFFINSKKAKNLAKKPQENCNLVKNATRPKKGKTDYGYLDGPVAPSSSDISDIELEQEKSLKTRVLKEMAKKPMKKHASDSEITDLKEKPGQSRQKNPKKKKKEEIDLVDLMNNLSPNSSDSDFDSEAIKRGVRRSSSFHFNGKNQFFFNKFGC